MRMINGMSALAACLLVTGAQAESVSVTQSSNLTLDVAQSNGASVTRGMGDRLADQLSVRDFGAACNGTTDDSLALSLAAAALSTTGRSILIPAGCQLSLGSAARLAGKPVVLDTVSLVGEAGRDSGNSAGAYGTRGSTILLRDTVAAALIVKRNVSIRHLIFYWPGVTEAATTANGNTPPAYPALIAGPGSAGGTAAETSSLRFEDNDVVNATNVIDVHADTSGALFISGNRAFFTGIFLNLGSMPLESFVHDNHFTPNAYESNALVGPTYNLWNYAALHAEIVRATGNGAANTNPTSGADQGLSFHNNFVFGLGYGFRALGGWLDMLDVSDNEFDEVPHPLYVDVGGAVDGRWDGGIINNALSANAQPTTTAANAVFYWSPKSAPGATLAIDHVRIQFSTGPFLDVENTVNPISVIVTNPDWESGAVAGTTDAIVWNSEASTRPILQGGTISMGSSSSAAKACVNLASNTQTLMITGVTFVYCGTVISAAGTASAGAGAVVANNVSAGTRTAIYGGAFPQFLPDSFNSWDLPHYGWSMGQRLSDGSYIVSYKGTPMLSLSEQGAVKAAGAVTPATTP